MPTADRSLKDTVIGWAVAAIYIAYCTSFVCTATCNAPSDSGLKNKRICNVSYTDTLVLECPDPASQEAASWKKKVNESYSVMVCSAEGPECNLNSNRNLTNQDSGIYFCEILNGSDPSLEYYVEITVLAPPSLRNVVYCERDDASLCIRQSIRAHLWDRFTVTIEFSGIGPFSVQWKHNNSDFNCQKFHYCRENNSTNEMSLQFLANPNPEDVVGNYSAIVSNHYGWNVSVTNVIITYCAHNRNPVSTTPNSTITLTDGASANVSCKLNGDSDNYLTVCFGKYDQNFSDFTNDSINDQYCTLCPRYSQGKCNLLPPKPEWEVHRKEDGECLDMLENDIVIKDFSKNDEGNILCFYGGDEDRYNLYTTYTLTYKTGTSKLYIMYIVVVVGILVLLLIVLAVACRLWRRRKVAATRLVYQAETCHYRSFDSIPEEVAGLLRDREDEESTNI